MGDSLLLCSVWASAGVAQRTAGGSRWGCLCMSSLLLLVPSFYGLCIAAASEYLDFFLSDSGLLEKVARDQGRSLESQRGVSSAAFC